MRTNIKVTVLSVLAALVVAGCEPEEIITPGEEAPNSHPEMTGLAARVLVDVEHGTITVLPPDDGAGNQMDVGPHAILGPNEIQVTAANITSTVALNRLNVTFDVAITNRLTSMTLVPPTFPSGTVGSTGLLLFPFRVTQVVGADPSQVDANTEWNGDGTPGSGAPRNFFNDPGCVARANTDCFRWEQFPSPLGPGQTTAGRRVGFTGPRTLRSFQALLILAADVRNDLPAVASVAVTPTSYVMRDGRSAGFSAMAYDALNLPLPWATITWTSPDLTAIEFQYGSALVGTITGPSVIVHGRKVGQTYITASSGGVSVRVPVDIQVNTIVLVQPYIRPDSQLVVGEQVQAEASVKDNSGQIVPNFPPIWSTSDSSCATVNPATGLITAVGAGTCNIIATAAAASGVIPISVNGPPSGNITGTVTDLDGKPVAGASVHALGVSDLSVTTGANGSYDFGGILRAPSSYSLDFSKAGCVTRSATTTLAVNQAAAINASLDCPPRVRGRVTDTQGPLRPDLTSVELVLVGTVNVLVAPIQPDGTYDITVPSGRYFISIGSPGQCTYTLSQITLAQQDPPLTVDLVVTCARTGGVYGTVVDLEDVPVVGAAVSAQNQVTGQQFSGTTNSNGIYDILGMPPGSYLVTSQKAGCLFGATATVDIPLASIPQNLSLNCPASVHGTVTDPYGNPIPSGMTVRATSLSEEVMSAVAPNGSYGLLVTGSSLENYGLSLRGEYPACDPITLGYGEYYHQQGSYQRDFTIDCRPSVLSLYFNDGASNLSGNPQPLMGAVISITQFGVAGVTDYRGRVTFTIPPHSSIVPSGEFTPAGCDGYSFTVSNIDPPRGPSSATLPVRCDRTGALQGTIRTALGNPLPNINVLVAGRVVITDANGHWGLAGIPGGLTQVTRLDAPTGCAPSVPITVAVINNMTITQNETVSCSSF